MNVQNTNKMGTNGILFFSIKKIDLSDIWSGRSIEQEIKLVCLFLDCLEGKLLLQCYTLAVRKRGVQSPKEGVQPKKGGSGLFFAPKMLNLPVFFKKFQEKMGFGPHEPQPP